MTSPSRSGHLDVGDGQQVWFEEWGNPQGVPFLYVHGGPGGTLGTSAYRERFDLSCTRLIGFEQRGCGRSLPHASDPHVCLTGNDTWALVADMEALREHLGVDRWALSGASWGCTLALAYATTHPERVLGLVLYAVTTTSRAEVDWITEGVSAIFPEAWDRFAGHAEAAGIGYRRGHGRLVEAYAALMECPDPDVREAASQEWALWEDTHVSIGAGGFSRDPRWADAAFRHAFLRLTAHYWSNDAFADPPLLERIDALAGVPGVLLHGRRDISSPVRTAWEVHRRWTGSRLLVDEGDGHGGSTMAQAWAAAHAELARRFS